MSRLNRLLLVCVCTTLPALSYAALGGDSASIAVDNKALASSVSNVVTTTASNSNYQMATIKTTDGHTINEYSVPNGGRVFCVTWHGRSYPDFKQILGSDAPQLKTATKSSQGLTSSNLNGNDFTFKMSGLPGNFSGVAYKPSLVPANVNVDSLK